MTTSEPEWITHAVRRYARSQPTRPAVTDADTGESVTWQQLDESSDAVARAFVEHGVRVGDLVTIALWNGIPFVEAAVAAWKVGATPQPLSQKLAVPEFTAIVELGRPGIVIGDRELSSRFGVTMHEVSDLRERGRASHAELPDVLAPSIKAPTSGGSTGRPKIILSGSPAVVDEGFCELWYLRGDTVALISAPMHHNAPHMSMYNALSMGGHVVLMSRFDPERVLQNIQRYQATWLYTVPVMMHRIWNLPEAVRQRYDVRSLQTVWHMGAPCPRWLKHHWIEWLGPEKIHELYGGTEGQAATTISGTEWLEHEGSVGVVKSGEIVVLDDQRQPVATGESGELWMRRLADRAEPTYRYIGAEPTTLRRDAGYEWESIGDIGYFDPDGYLYLRDRMTDMILVGGINVFPAEIEAVLESYPGVEGSAVIGLPDDEYGNRIHAILHAGRDLDLDSLRAHLAENLSGHKLPKTIEITDEPLRDATGKSRRSALRAARL